MKNAFWLLWSVFSTTTFAQENPAVNPVRFTASQQQTLQALLKSVHMRYDERERMLATTVEGYQYHRDATGGTLHEIRGSFSYALALLNSGDPALRQRAFAVLERCIGLQDTLANSPTRGIWAYYLEESLQTKKTPPDFNMADFNAVTLLDIRMSHGEQLPPALNAAVKKSLILAAESIKKRDMGPYYTNISAMGSYVTYMVGYLFGLPGMLDYARKRIETFYAYTLRKGGFTEYNSPTYTITALEELNRMQQHIAEPAVRQMADSLYALGWTMLARHYHRPTGQWTGPHSRSYSTLVKPGFYYLLHEASGGTLYPEAAKNLDWSTYGRLTHRIPDHLMPYFTRPVYPRLETDVFEPDAPEIKGTSYLTDGFAVSTANRSSMWNQRRPFLAYWGSVAKPRYLQVRFLHDDYDFSSASFYSQQRDGQVLAAINLNTNAGDKHITLDVLKDGVVQARDLRLRFEFGNQTDSLSLPSALNEPVLINSDGLRLSLNLFSALFDGKAGHWETGGKGNTRWLDYVLYSGPVTRFDLNQLRETILGFTFHIGEKPLKTKAMKPDFTIINQHLNTGWQGMSLSVPVNILPQPGHVGWY
nr:hypothetical protein [uncultured Arsenicibacter sp.]